MPRQYGRIKMLQKPFLRTPPLLLHPYLGRETQNVADASSRTSGKRPEKFPQAPMLNDRAFTRFDLKVKLGIFRSEDKISSSKSSIRRGTF